MNCRSLSKNIDVIYQYILDYNHIFTAMTETWLNPLDKMTITMLESNGHTLIHMPRQNSKRGGGIGILFRKNIKIHSTKEIICTSKAKHY